MSNQLAMNAVTPTHMVDDGQSGVFVYFKDANGTELVLHANAAGIFDANMVEAQQPIVVTTEVSQVEDTVTNPE